MAVTTVAEQQQLKTMEKGGVGYKDVGRAEMLMAAVAVFFVSTSNFTFSPSFQRLETLLSSKIKRESPSLKLVSKFVEKKIVISVQLHLTSLALTTAKAGQRYYQ